MSLDEMDTTAGKSGDGVADLVLIPHGQHNIGAGIWSPRGTQMGPENQMAGRIADA